MSIQESDNKCNCLSLSCVSVRGVSGAPHRCVDTVHLSRQERPHRVARGRLISDSRAVKAELEHRVLSSEFRNNIDVWLNQGCLPLLTGAFHCEAFPTHGCLSICTPVPPPPSNNTSLFCIIAPLSTSPLPPPPPSPSCHLGVHELFVPLA